MQAFLAVSERTVRSFMASWSVLMTLFMYQFDARMNQVCGPNWRNVLAGEKGIGGTAVTAIVGLVVALVVLANLAPIALESLMDVDTTGWDTEVEAIWGVLIILIVVGLLFLVWRFVESRRMG
jgi:uncharacterized membrane protein